MMIVISVTASYADGAYRLPGKLDVLPVSVTERKSDYAILLFVLDVDAEELEIIRVKLLHQYYKGDIYSMKLTLL